LREVASTNSYLSELLREVRLPEGAAVTAYYQEAGRGQRDNPWHSAPGLNLLVSYVFYPVFLNAYSVFQLNMAVSVALGDFAASFLGDTVRIKWPNDLYYANKKLGGLLIENSIYEFQVRQSIVGIGININQPSFPEDLPNPVSFHQVTGQAYMLDDLFASLSNCLERRYLELKRNGEKGIREAYHRHLLRHGKWEWFQEGDRRFEGMVMGVNKDGHLLIQNKEGHTENFGAKEVKYLF
jgi:BirA family biotin operon repressor/biotin-[acetyl-CoA-carboxylase] ligase